MANNLKGKAPVLVVLQMTGGNDFMNTLVPYTSGLYYDSRQTVRITEDRVYGRMTMLPVPARFRRAAALVLMAVVAVMTALAMMARAVIPAVIRLPVPNTLQQTTITK